MMGVAILHHPRELLMVWGLGLYLYCFPTKIAILRVSIAMAVPGMLLIATLALGCEPQVTGVEWTLSTRSPSQTKP